MKNYGEYSLSKIKYEPQNDNIINKNPLLIYDEVNGMQKYRNNL